MFVLVMLCDCDRASRLTPVGVTRLRILTTAHSDKPPTHIHINTHKTRTWMGLAVSTVVEAMAMNMPCAATMCAYETTAT